MQNKSENVNRRKKRSDETWYREIFEKAYHLMDEPVIDGNCGELCGYHCCRHSDPSGDRMGMYLLPLEFEFIQSGRASDYEVHSHQLYEMPPKVKKLYYIFCNEADGCLRDMRPVQCRTYPFEPHLEDCDFSLVIERDQIHECPLLSTMPKWRQEFINGIYEGWLELMKIPIIRYHVSYYSSERVKADNIAKRYNRDGWIF